MVVHTGAVGWYREQVLPRIANVLLGVREFVPLRGRVASGLEGDVLEIGFGSGLNVPHYPSTVRRVRASLSIADDMVAAGPRVPMLDPKPAPSDDERAPTSTTTLPRRSCTAPCPVCHGPGRPQGDLRVAVLPRSRLNGLSRDCET